MMTVPRELSVRNGRIYANPVRELEQYRTEPVEYQNVTIQGERELDGIRGRVMDLAIEILSGEYESFRILVAKDERFYTEISYDPREQILTFDRTYSGMRRDFACRRSMFVRAHDGRITLRILLDRYSVEIFANDGESVMTSVIPTRSEADRILFNVQGRAEVSVVKYGIREDRE